MTSNNHNSLLIAGGILSIIASLLHIAIIMGGAEWYRFFGAGEELASMAEQGSWYPGLITFGISIVLFTWGLCAFSGANLIRKLPFLKVSLVIISAIYLVRGIAIIPAYFLQPNLIDQFLIWSSAICVIYGLLYATGTVQVWSRLTATKESDTH